MSAGTAPGGTAWRLEIYDELGSTSDYCIAQAGQGAEAGLAVMARRQTSGRGSRGRDWQDPGGNLAFSVLLRPAGVDGAVGLWPFVAGLAFHGAILPWIDDPALLRLKWPNDLLLAGRKTAGILIESGSDATGRWLVIGFGANLRAVPSIAGRALACVADYGTAPEPELVARGICAELDRWQAVWRDRGFDVLRTAWLERAHPVGTRLVVRGESGQLEGSFVGLDAQGMLLLRCAEGVKRISTGEILLLDRDAAGASGGTGT
ncbi:biotin--[acetyl-CoA-carboxylase] ligase [Gluconacetobacter takamatsuzukensis]|uniref:biotin--[biotin carboxyl-carrier protein] ligase n=1 Tax=Gluconacetobacter takamatsuzukensis TaxID=1286190 RepID=A0A7W4PSQ7_9PROT|nr:biotin--[acetyl-CoA-carboxylase] ligase [Gluconacetobacter takamatsuzukensis]